jgi:hypothetical protein
MVGVRSHLCASLGFTSKAVVSQGVDRGLTVVMMMVLGLHGMSGGQACGAGQTRAVLEPVLLEAGRAPDLIFFSLMHFC